MPGLCATFPIFARTGCWLSVTADGVETFLEVLTATVVVHTQVSDFEAHPGWVV